MTQRFCGLHPSYLLPLSSPDIQSSPRPSDRTITTAPSPDQPCPAYLHISL